MRLKDRVAVVTGSASGIGKAIANRLAREGAFLIIADKNESAIGPAVEEIMSAGGSAAGISVDVTQRDQLQECMAKIVENHKGVDILVNNAGLTRYRPFLTAGDEDWDVVLNVVLKGSFYCAQAAAPHMIRQGYGKIVNISSSSRHRRLTPPHSGLPGRQLGIRLREGGRDPIDKDARARTRTVRYQCKLRRARVLPDSIDGSDAYPGTGCRPHRSEITGRRTEPSRTPGGTRRRRSIPRVR